MRFSATNEVTSLLRFGTVGLAQNAVSFAGYLILERALGSHIWAMTIAYLAGLTFAYLGNSSWTFKTQGSAVATLPRFVLLYGFGYAWSLTVHLLLVDQADMNHALAQSFAIISCAALMYGGQRFWIFR